MCEHGTTTKLFVKVLAEQSYTGEDRWDYKNIDSCIAPIVKALQEGNINMKGSCCGHDKEQGNIILQDGRVLKIIRENDFDKKQVIESIRKYYPCENPDKEKCDCNSCKDDSKVRIMNEAEKFDKMFDEKFPSLDNGDWDEGGGFRCEALIESCQDNKRLREAIERILPCKGAGNDINTCVCPNCINACNFIKELRL